MTFYQRVFHRPFFIRLFNWEYWSFGAIYACIYPIYFALCLRNRSLFFFAAANPRIRNGGFLCESKKDIAALIPAAYHPRSLFIDLPADPDKAVQELSAAGLLFPLIGKPNMGGRGRGISMLRDEQAVRRYVARAQMDFHIQEFIVYPNEAGIFYCRYPGEAKGKITGIVQKLFLTVKGDGRNTMRQLLQQDRRSIMYLAGLDKLMGAQLDTVLPAGEERILSPYGNHARGAKFLDHTHLVDETLTASIDAVCRQIPEFYYGRLDIRYRSWEELRQGRHFTIIEVNGAGAEPTHMYDPKHSLFFAWKEIVRHWFILATISRLNHRKGHRYLSFKEGLAMFREDKEWSRRLEAMGE
ncbi:MAG: hypothetical protein P0Y53_20305 [Candidatus Pseudobacter hemicellulosilyticus]|uniref:ATP-grasp domain-containing protein n=1 Tax=Candidatus Pseudobacter hemicellulosilyticus TaxID=3121375 RepID=A0AAJ6BG15_9BACT|nr:MAG: hypothetical protein P0Y53_20305 [Pseudobacter sp.]